MLKPTVFFQYIMTMWKNFSNPQKLKLRGVVFARRLGLETDVRESKTVLDSGLHALDSKFQLLDSRSFSVELGSWIPIVIGILDSYSCIPDSKSQDSGFHRQKFPRFRNPDSFTWGEAYTRSQSEHELSNHVVYCRG